MKKHLFMVAIIMIIAMLSSCNQTDTIACNSCGANNPIQAKFCLECGDNLAAETTLAPDDTQAPETTSEPETTVAPETTEAPHVHAWSDWDITLKSTCAEEGKQERSCSCGEKETQSISALGHTEVIDESVAATCEKEGKTEGKHCSVCGVVTVKQKAISMLNHNYVNRVCSVCGYLNGSAGLNYWLSDDKTYYSVSIGTCTDENIVIPRSYRGVPVKSIRIGAFSYNKSIKSVIIPDSVTSIEGTAFDGCTSLTSVTIPDSVTSIGNCAFNNCTSLTSIIIPNSVTSIGVEVFYGCKSLTSITIPDSVTSIGEGMFENCSSLTSVTIGNSVVNIGDMAFSSCTSLTSITIPDSVLYIGSFAFHGCLNLTNVTIGKGVISIGLYAFSYCSSLKDIYYTGTEAGWKLILETAEFAGNKFVTNKVNIIFDSKN